MNPLTHRAQAKAAAPTNPAAARRLSGLLLVYVLLTAACAPVQQPALLAPTPAPTATSPVTPVAQATAEPTPAPSSAAPAVIAFTVQPTATLAVGDPITVTWQAVGDQAELCMISGPGPVDCQPAPLTGGQRVTVTAPMLAYSGIGLRVSAGGTFTWATADLRFACQAGAWFFDNPPPRCPEHAPEQSAAAYQPFEHGFMVWTQTPDRFYVFFADGERAGQFLFADAPYDFSPEQPATETPPAGFFMPVSGFGKLWRSELSAWRDVNIRGELGWATAPEAAYDAIRQCELPGYPGMWNCYLQMPDGRIANIRPDSTAQVHFVWAWH